LLATITPPRARAQERLPLELQWQAPPECPDADAVRTDLQRSARVQPGFELTPLRAHATVEQRGAIYATTLYTEHAGETGERALQAADCAELTRAVTLVLALAFGAGVEVKEPPAAATRNEATPAPTAPAVPAPTPKADQSQPSTTAPITDRSTTDERAWRWSALAGGGAQLGLLPAAAFTASAGAEVAFASLSIGLRAIAWPAVNDAVTPQIDARFDGLGGALQGCGRLPLSSLVLAACAEARAAALRGRSSGATHDASAVAPWYAIAAAAAITWPRTGALSLRLQAALAASLNRPRFVITNLQQAHRVPELAPDFTAFVILTP
jgi:hypothetical protein